MIWGGFGATGRLFGAIWEDLWQAWQSSRTTWGRPGKTCGKAWQGGGQTTFATKVLQGAPYALEGDPLGMDH